MTTASNINVDVMNHDSRANTYSFYNADDSIRVKVNVTPGKMVLKLERQGGQLEFATRHGHTLDEVRARAAQMVEMRSLAAARRLFRAQA